MSADTATATTLMWRTTTSDQSIEIPAVSSPVLVEGEKCVLLWQVKGESSFDVDGVAMTLGEGFALWIPSGCRHSFVVRPNSSLLPIFFDDAVATSLDRPTILTIDEHAETACFALISSQYSIIAPDTDLAGVVVSLLEAQVALSSDVRLPRTTTALRIARSLVLNPADRRTLSEWAKVVHLSTRSLERAFLNETGLTWRQWRTTCRMARAARLLSRGSVSVTAVAQLVGFETHSSFARAFREFHGISPTAYRERCVPPPTSGAA